MAEDRQSFLWRSLRCLIASELMPPKDDRTEENLFQAIFTLIMTGAWTFLGVVRHRTDYPLFYVLIGLVLSFFVSGFIVMLSRWGRERTLK